MKEYNLIIDSLNDNEFQINEKVDTFLDNNSNEFFDIIIKECLKLIENDQEPIYQQIYINLKNKNNYTISQFKIGVTGYESLINYVTKHLEFCTQNEYFERCIEVNKSLTIIKNKFKKIKDGI